MKCWAHCTFSAPIFWITCKFWNVHQTMDIWWWWRHRHYCNVWWLDWIQNLTLWLFALLTCRGWIPEAMRSLIIRTWARAFGSAGSKQGPGLVSSMYWITASYVRKKYLYCSHWWSKYGFVGGHREFRLTDWESVNPSISTAGTCCMGFNVLYCSVSLGTRKNDAKTCTCIYSDSLIL